MSHTWHICGARFDEGSNLELHLWVPWNPSRKVASKSGNKWFSIWIWNVGVCWNTISRWSDDVGCLTQRDRSLREESHSLYEVSPGNRSTVITTPCRFSVLSLLLVAAQRFWLYQLHQLYHYIHTSTYTNIYICIHILIFTCEISRTSRAEVLFDRPQRGQV